MCERMNSVISKIKPCLCGLVPSLMYERVGYYDDRLYFFMHCEKCGIKMEGTPHSPFSSNEEKMKFEEKIVEKWNEWVLRYNKRSESLMNKMKEVANILNVEIGEEFRATGKDEDFRIIDSMFERLTICNEWVEAPSDILYDLLTGKREVIKIPWKPKAGERFFTCVRGYYVNQERWTNCAADLMAYAVGNCFRTPEEAKAHCKEVLDRLQRIYDEGKPLI